jgi:hypothetical protein
MLEELIKSVLKRFSKTRNYEGEVVSVDEVKETCVVKPVDAPELLGVRLKSIIGNTTTSLVIVPKVGSYVTVSVLNNIETETYVTQFSEVEKILTNCDNVIYNGGSKGGLVNWPDAKVQLDKTNEVLQVVVDSLKNFVPVAGDGGAALKTYFNTQLGVKTVGDFDNLEDTKVKH